MAGGSHGAVLVGVDGSQDATTGLAWALRHAQVAGLAVCVVHVWLPDEQVPAVPRQSCSHLDGHLDGGYGQRVVRDRAMTEQDARQRVHQSLGAATARVPIGRSLVTQLVLRGEPGVVLTELSRDGTQLVVGATGTGALPGILTPALGSTTRFVLRHAWCPVTVVPSARLRADLVTHSGPGYEPGYGPVPPARRPHAGS